MLFHVALPEPEQTQALINPKTFSVYISVNMTSPTMGEDDATSSGNATHRMSMKKKSLLALSSFAAILVCGTFFVVNGTEKDAAKAIDVSKIESVADGNGCEDARRVLVVPGIEEFESPTSSSNEVRKRRTLKLKGLQNRRKRKVS